MQCIAATYLIKLSDKITQVASMTDFKGEACTVTGLDYHTEIFSFIVMLNVKVCLEGTVGLILISLLYQVISAQQLPKPEWDKPSSIVDPQVWVEIHGVSIDKNKKKTHHVDNNGSHFPFGKMCPGGY